MAFFGLGSQSSDFSPGHLTDNPLPPCPGTPNCIRIGRKIKGPKAAVLKKSVSILQSMQPESLSISDDKNRISCVFKLFIFRDDLSIQLTNGPNQTSTHLFLRSASRKGMLDLGVNRRRVQSFLEKMNLKL